MSIIKKLIPILLICLASFFIFIILYSLWNRSLLIPINYKLDSLWSLEGIKSLIEGNSFFNNPYLGAPLNSMTFDYPKNELLFLFIIKFFTFFTKNPFLIINIFYIFSFLLIGIFSFFVFRHFKISIFNSFFGSLLFTYLPFRLMREQLHLYLTSYFLIPPSIMVMLWISEIKDFTNKKMIISFIVSILVGIAGIYYAFFTIILFIFSGLISYYYNKNKKIIFLSWLLSFIIFFTVFLTLLPTINNQIKNGKNSVAATRHPVESEIYGLRITQLFLPLRSYRIPILTKVRNLYFNQSFVARGENSEYLGIIGIIGFLFLLVKLFDKKNINKNSSKLLNSLSYLNIIALLLGVTTGFGTIIAYFLSAEIRAYNRISVFIAFFSIFACLIIFDILIKKIKTKFVRIIFYSFLTFLFLAALFDQIYWLRPLKDNYLTTKKEFLSNKKFIEKIESSVPKEAMIFQLPYKAFPESPQINQLKDYDLLYGYLHSKNLKWSYGSIKGRENDLWLQETNNLPLKNMLEKVSLAGFEGIYIDKFGYEDNGASLEAELKNILKEKPLTSENQRLMFFNLEKYNDLIKDKFSEKEYKQKKYQILHPLFYKWENGFTELEYHGDDYWLWSDHKSTLYIINMSEKKRKIKMQFLVASSYNENSIFNIKSNILTTSFNINSIPKNFTKEITLKPGNNTINFSTTAKKTFSPGDPRNLFVRIINFKLNDLE